MSVWSILLAVLVLGILAAFHETGHFFVAKWLKVKVEEFSVFVGPSLVSWKRKGVDYHIRLFPFGAYVRYKGMEEESDTEDPDMFLNQPRWKRLVVSLAGPFTNFLLGMAIFAVIFSQFGYGSTRVAAAPEGSQLHMAGVGEGDRILFANGKRILTGMDLSYLLSMITDTQSLDFVMESMGTGERYTAALTPKIAKKYRLGFTYSGGTDENGGYTILEVDPASNEGSPVLEIGDSILSVNDIPVTDPDFSMAIAESRGEDLRVRLIRDQVDMEVKMRATAFDTGNPRGISLLSGHDFRGIMEQSLYYPVSYFRLTFSILGDMFSGRVAPEDTLSGPLGVMTVVSEVVDTKETDTGVKVEQMGILSGVISVALAFSNMLPIPGLDGNSLVLLLIEMVRGKKLSLRAEGVINAIGFVCLILLAGLALFSDIFRLVR